MQWSPHPNIVNFLLTFLCHNTPEIISRRSARPLSPRRPKSAYEKFADAVSMLKRAASIPNSPTKKDGPAKTCKDVFEVHTSDYDSALILANLISQTVLKMSGHTEKFWQHPKRQGFGWHDDMPLIHDGGDNYRVFIYLPQWAFVKMAELLVEKAQELISPDNRRGRNR